MPGAPVDAQTRAKIVEAAQEGRSRNDVAREFGVAGSTVTRICADAGVTFDRSLTALAVRAHSLDVAAAQAVLVKSMLIEAQDQLEGLDDPYLVWSFGGMDNSFSSELLDTAPMDIRNIAMRSAAVASDKADRFLSRTTGGSAAAVSLIDSLEAGISAFARAARAETTDADQ